MNIINVSNTVEYSQIYDAQFIMPNVMNEYYQDIKYSWMNVLNFVMSNLLCQIYYAKFIMPNIIEWIFSEYQIQLDECF